MAEPVAVHLSAELDGAPISLSDVGRYHCHNLLAPRLRCFLGEEERDADISAVGAVNMGTASVTYVIAYENPNYGGSSLHVSSPLPDLSTIGWSNRISSFKSTNGGHPKWWDLTNYSGSSWQWGTSYWVPYVGDEANNRFSSVKNVP